MSAALEIMVDDFETAGDTLKRARLDAGFRRQADLADAIGCQQQQVSDWERGQWPVPDEFVQPVAEKFGLGVDDVERLNKEIRDSKPRTRPYLPRTGTRPDMRVSDWLNAVGGDRNLSTVARVVLMYVPNYIEKPPALEAFVTPNDLVEHIVEVTAANVDDVWDEITSSGYLAPVSGSSRVFALVMKK